MQYEDKSNHQKVLGGDRSQGGLEVEMHDQPRAAEENAGGESWPREKQKSRSLINLIGFRFGRLVVAERAGSNIHGMPMWLCHCECGVKKVIRGAHLRDGKIMSCGCKCKPLPSEMPPPIPGAKFVPLTKGKFAIVDEDDYKRVNFHSWHCTLSRRKKYVAYGARKVPDENGKERHQSIHAFILGYFGPLEIDHIDGNPLNNRKSNLRISTRHQNMWNVRLSASNKSGFKGVWRDKKLKKNFWKANIKAGGKAICLGRFATPEEAHAAYCAAAVKLHGEFARFS